MNDLILTINAGSSSLKFAVFDHDGPMVRVVEGQFERIGLPDGTLAVTDRGNPRPERRELALANHAACVPPLMAVLERRFKLAGLRAIGHRVVHGGVRYGNPGPSPTRCWLN